MDHLHRPSINWVIHIQTPTIHYETDVQSRKCTIRALPSGRHVLETPVQCHVDGSPRCRFVRPPLLPPPSPNQANEAS
jgi:hypothetical protein